MRLFWGLRGHEPVEVKSGASELEIEKDGHGMREHFANKAMLKMPQIMHPKAGHGKALRQMRAHGFHSLTQAGASLSAEEVERFDAEHSRLLATIAPDEFTVLHQMAIHVYVRKGTRGAG